MRKHFDDFFNSHLVDQADWDSLDIPHCPTTALEPPSGLMSYPKALTLHNHQMAMGNTQYHVNAFLHTCTGDARFDGPRAGIWKNPERYLDIASHFSGIITPDFSTNAEIPLPYKLMQTYRMRALGYYAGMRGHSVINNVRWDKPASWGFCYAGIDTDSMVFVGALASGLRLKENWPLYVNGFRQMVHVLKPRIIIVLGGPEDFPLYQEVRRQGIDVRWFRSETNEAFLNSPSHEERSDR